MEKYRSYYDLPTVAEGWGVKACDVLRLGEIGHIRLSAFIRNVTVTCPRDRFTWLSDDGSIVVPIANFEGLVDLSSHDVQTAARRGCVSIKKMRNAKGWHLYTAAEQAPIPILKEDLLLRGRERKDFEQTYEERHPPPMETHAEDGRVFRVSENYRQVWLGEEEFRFGPKQARVIELLHAAARRGEPRQSGKYILGLAGSQSGYIGDLFPKGSPWRILVGSDRAGMYWLKINVPDADARRPTIADYVEELLTGAS